MKIRIKKTGQIKIISNEQGKKLVEKGEAETLPMPKGYSTRQLKAQEIKTK